MKNQEVPYVGVRVIPSSKWERAVAWWELVWLAICTPPPSEEAWHTWSTDPDELEEKEIR